MKKISREELLEMIGKSVPGFDAALVRDDSRLVDLGIDSLGFATLLFAIEDALGVQIDESKLGGLSGQSSLRELSDVFRGLGYAIEL